MENVSIKFVFLAILLLTSSGLALSRRIEIGEKKRGFLPVRCSKDADCKGKCLWETSTCVDGLCTCPL
ncbi:hypothetical protein JCGZ_11752 [Jatropha curcas]|uniref:Uncharacterized protein n=1 Tax=Jatropha curcas TaxID=180498 RepID=A0A067K572_JATCU|nr:hypothetical protein JCGZ_11752 [Jatropha curcas]